MGAVGNFVAALVVVVDDWEVSQRLGGVVGGMTKGLPWFECVDV